MIKSSVILLAGGASTRMGQPKALLEFKSKKWIQHQIESLKQIGFKKIIVVLGFSNELILPHLTYSEVEVAINPNPEAGQFSSLQCGLKRVADGQCFVLPIDVPSPGKEIWLEMESVEGANVVQPAYEGRLGHPIWLGAQAVQTLLFAPKENRLDVMLRHCNDRKTLKTLDRLVLLNLNTPVAFKQWAEVSG